MYCFSHFQGHSSVAFRTFGMLWNRHRCLVPDLSLQTPPSSKPYTQSLPIHRPRHPRQPLIFLSLWICLFWIFHVNGILRYVGFCFNVYSLFIYVFLPVLGLHYCKWGLLPSWGAQASHCGDFSCCGAQASAVVAPKLCCFTARGIFPHQGSNLHPLH